MLFARKFPRTRVDMTGIHEIWATDLIDKQAFSKYNNLIKYLLTVIDISSKFVWIILEWKTGQEVANAFSRILMKRRPSKIWVDKYRKFYNKDVH